MGGLAESPLGGSAAASPLRPAGLEAGRWESRPGGLAACPHPAVQEVPQEWSEQVADSAAPFPAAGAAGLANGPGQRQVPAFPAAIPSAALWTFPLAFLWAFPSAAPWAAHGAAPVRPEGDRPLAAEAVAARAASARLAAAVLPEVQDAQPGVAAEAAGPSAVQEAVAAPDVGRPEAEAVRPLPAAAAASALPLAFPWAAASACRRDRALPVAPGLRQWGRPRHAMRSLQIASPLAQSWQAAGDEVWSCDVGSRNQR